MEGLSVEIVPREGYFIGVFSGWEPLMSNVHVDTRFQD
jgi:hypothetical protein